MGIYSLQVHDWGQHAMGTRGHLNEDRVRAYKDGLCARRHRIKEMVMVLTLTLSLSLAPTLTLPLTLTPCALP